MFWVQLLYLVSLKKRRFTMRKINTLFALLFLATGAFAQTTWTLDKNHTKIGFMLRTWR